MRPHFIFSLLLFAPLALAQEHEHGGDAGMAMALHDGPDDGRAVVGAYTHFGFALMDKDGRPVVHQNAEFVVKQADEVLFATTDAHEYDGLFSLDLRFTRPGPYEVVATSGEMQLGTFRGEVIAPVNATVATIGLTTAPAGLPNGNAVAATLAIVGPDGAILPHTDAIVEFRETRSRALASRAHFHVHDAPIAFTQGLGVAGDYTATVVAYKAFATGRSPDVQAVYGEFPVMVGPAAAPALPPLEPPATAVLEPQGASAEADGYALHGMYDPQSQVGVGQPVRLAALFVDTANRTPVAHVDFALTLAGPRGLVFESSSLHEYDGMFEHTFVPDAPGIYAATLTASRGDTVLEVPYRVQVLPPLVALEAGLATVGIEGLDAIVAGEPANLTFTVMGPDGPAAHTEVDVTIAHHDEAPLYQFKLHTHDSGLTSAQVVLPHAGDWFVTIDALPTAPEPLVFVGPAGPGQPVAFPFAVAEGAPHEADVVEDAAAAGSLPVPGAPVAGLLALLVLAALVRR